MRSAVLLGFLWTASILGLISASAVSRCKDDKRTCNHVRAIVQVPADVREVSQKYPRALEVDFHGNLLEKYEHPPAAQWKKLNLSYNLLKEDMFKNIQTNLEVIDLTYNQLKTVSVPSSVIEFIAERNQLYGITFGWQSRLQKLILPKNQFQSLDLFNSLSKLQELDLSCNDLSELNLDLLPTSLRTLKLARNHIHSISGSQTLQSLEYMDLSHNILTMFSVVVFPNVKYLFLQNNKIVMWVDERPITNKFQQLNLIDNDWDCKTFKAVLNQINKINGRTLQMERSEDRNCVNEHNICCTRAEAPYADRLIKYRKQEFKALKEGTDLREGNNASCAAYKPNPCDGDDNLVYEVAGSAAKDAKSLAESSLQELDGMLKQEQKILDLLKLNVTAFEAQNNELSREQADLVSYIKRQYEEKLPPTEQLLNGQKDQEVKKLQQIFDFYAKENDNLKQQITTEERNNRDKLDEVNTLEREMEDLNYQKDRLMEEINRRNATVEDYKRKIQTLQTKLQG